MPLLTVNGREEEFAETEFPHTVLDLLRSKGIKPAAVIIELDGAIIPRDDFAGQELLPGNCVEIIQFVGGG